MVDNLNCYSILRKIFMPDKITILFVGDCPPESGTFFYNPENPSILGKTTKEAFERAYNVKFRTYRDFLEFFRSKGCFLYNLFEEPGKSIEVATKEEIESAKENLADFIRKHEPSIVIAILKRIHEVVKEAVEQSGKEIKMYSLPFPTYFRDKYIEKLINILREANL